MKITQKHFDKVRSLYFNWKELNYEIKQIYARGINLPEALTEPICCFINDFELSLGNGSEDAWNGNKKVQIKATSNWDNDLTSFGPRTEFDYLHFIRLNQSEDKMYLYDIPTKDLNNIMVNQDQTFREQQLEGRRPRFSIINKYIKLENIKPYAVVDLKTGDYKFL